jgi:hypothetical protein
MVTAVVNDVTPQHQLIWHCCLISLGEAMSNVVVSTSFEFSGPKKKPLHTANPAHACAASFAACTACCRDIKQKQRGGGGAILGYDPQGAAAAAAARAHSISGAAPITSQVAGSWSGAVPLPPIHGAAGEEWEQVQAEQMPRCRRQHQQQY